MTHKKISGMELSAICRQFQLAAARMRELYKAKGYGDDWINKPWAHSKNVLTFDCRR
jgi:hypothetical protein